MKVMKSWLGGVSKGVSKGSKGVSKGSKGSKRTKSKNIFQRIYTRKRG